MNLKAKCQLLHLKTSCERKIPKSCKTSFKNLSALCAFTHEPSFSSTNQAIMKNTKGMTKTGKLYKNTL